MTWENFSTSMSCVTDTVPGWLTRPMSFRPRSTSMMCSARCFSLLFNSDSFASSSPGVAPLGRVPAMGWVAARPAWTVTTVSMAAPTIWKSSRFK